MTHSDQIPLSDETLTPMKSARQQLGKFAACLFATAGLCITGYAFAVDALVPRSDVPATYKWFLLQEIPGPRIIFESGSNSHRGIDTALVGEALGMTAINIADNAGYPLEDKITRLETFARAGDIIVLPLEWTHYHREKLTDNYVETLFTENRDYFRSMPTIKRIKRALSLPPEKVISEISKRKSRPPLPAESPAMELHNAALTHPTGHSSRANPLGPGLGVAEQSCDDYILGKAPVRESIALGKNIKPALKRLQRLKARGVKVHFSWPVLVGQGCMMADSYVTGFRAEIEDAVNQAGFDFLGAPSQSVYGQEFQDDTPYHLIKKGAEIHTKTIISLLKAQGYGLSGSPFDIKTFARHRLLELELAEVKPISQTPFPINVTVAMEEENSRQYVEFSAGWWAFEPYGRWMRDNRAMFRMTLPEDIPSNSVLKIDGRTLSGQPETVDVSVNGTLMHSGAFGDGTPLLVPAGNLPKGTAFSVFLTLPKASPPQSPQDRGENEDTRSMTLHVQSLELTAAAKLSPNAVSVPVTAPSYVPAPILVSENNDLNQCAPSVSQNTPAFLRFHHTQGWWDLEPTGRWMKSQQASLKLNLPSVEQSQNTGRYILKIDGDFFMGRKRIISAIIDGKQSPPFAPTDSGELATSFDTNKAEGLIDVTLRIDGDVPQSPKTLGLSPDERTLTYFLKSAELIPV